MPTIVTTGSAEIFYKDWGAGRPVVFSHGWPLTADAWDSQMVFLGQRGYRVIAPASCSSSSALPHRSLSPVR